MWLLGKEQKSIGLYAISFGNFIIGARNPQPKALQQGLPQNVIDYLFFKTQKLPLFNDYTFRYLFITHLPKAPKERNL
jgi:hypothetical protein